MYSCTAVPVTAPAYVELTSHFMPVAAAVQLSPIYKYCTPTNVALDSETEISFNWPVLLTASLLLIRDQIVALTRPRGCYERKKTVRW